MTDSKVIYRTRSENAANAVSRILHRHAIPFATSPRLLGTLLPGTRFDEVAFMVDDENEVEAGELISRLGGYVKEHLSRVETEFAVLESRLSYVFRDRTFLEQALTHSSRAREDDTGTTEDNESLEFLGDAVLGLVITDRLYRDCPDYDEGQKSKLKAELVSSGTLSKIGLTLGLGEYLLLGRGEAKGGGRKKPSLLENAVEAMIAAVYLDGGYEAAAGCIAHLFAAELARLRRGGADVIGREDFKSALQEWLQSEGRVLPVYELAGTSGPPHEKTFTIQLCLDARVMTVGVGRSKKEAEQCAAEKALAALRNNA